MRRLNDELSGELVWRGRMNVCTRLECDWRGPAMRSSAPLPITHELGGWFYACWAVERLTKSGHRKWLAPRLAKVVGTFIQAPRLTKVVGTFDRFESGWHLYFTAAGDDETRRARRNQQV